MHILDILTFNAMFQDENILNSVMMFDTVLWDESIDTSENNTVVN